MPPAPRGSGVFIMCYSVNYPLKSSVNWSLASPEELRWRRARRKLRKAARRRQKHLLAVTSKLNYETYHVLLDRPDEWGDAVTIMYGPAKPAARIVRRLNARAAAVHFADPARPRAELLNGPQREFPTPPTRTMRPSPDFEYPRYRCHDLEELNWVLKFCRLDPYTGEPGKKYRCWCFYNEPTLDVIVQEKGDTIFHCYKCGYRLSTVEFLSRYFGGDLCSTAEWLLGGECPLASLTRNDIGDTEIFRRRMNFFDFARAAYAGMVGDGLIEATFGDWAVFFHDEILDFLLRERLPARLVKDFYIVGILKNQFGWPVAIDVFSRNYHPLFRHWLGPKESSLFMIPPWTDWCDWFPGLIVYEDASDCHAHELERSAFDAGLNAANPIALIYQESSCGQNLT